MNVVKYGVYSEAIPSQTAPPPDSYRGPGYPSLIALPWAVSGDVETTYWSVLILQALLGAATSVLVFLLARRWMGVGFALAAGMLVAVWPHLIVQGACLLTESVFGFLLVSAIYMTSGALTLQRIAYSVSAAIMFACAALINSMIVLLPLLVFGLILSARGWKHAVLFLALALTPPLLWAIRDTSIETPGVKSSGGRLFENVLIGLEPDFKPSYRDLLDPKAKAARERVSEGSALYYRDKRQAYLSVLTRIDEQPTRYLLWFLQKPVLLWRWDIAQGAGDIYIYPMVSSPFESNTFYRIIAALCSGLNLPLMLAAFGSAALLIRSAFRGLVFNQDPAYLLCGVFFLYAVIVHTVLTPDARYANPFRPFEIVLAISLAADVARYRRNVRSAAQQRQAQCDSGARADIEVQKST